MAVALNAWKKTCVLVHHHLLSTAQFKPKAIFKQPWIRPNHRLDNVDRPDILADTGKVLLQNSCLLKVATGLSCILKQRMEFLRVHTHLE